MNPPSDKFSAPVVWVTGLLLIGLTAVLFWLAQSFPYGQRPDRPIVPVVCVSWLASVVALCALFFGLRVKSNLKSLMGFVILVAIVTRLMLVFSNPILEVDYYRYLWDGIAANQGVAPYKYSPDAVLRSNADDPELKTLQAAIAKSPSAHTIVSRVHFEQYTTLYPPVSQFVFRTTTALIPDDASVATHIASIKFVLVLFDLGVMVVLAWLLSVFRKHPAWLLAYAWNPLVHKEIANGGHLDSIAIFFMTSGVAVFLWMACRWAGGSDEDDDSEDERETQTGSDVNAEANTASYLFASATSGVLMACAVGAKLFPVIFMPAMLVSLWARGRRMSASVFGAACIVGTLLVMWPMLNPANQSVAVQISDSESAPDKTDGLAVFMTQWRMNDAIFSGIYQNVEYDWGEHGPAWYVVVPNETRVQWCEDLSNVKLANGNPAYFVARLLTVALFGLFYLWILYRVWHTRSPSDLANLLFLIIGIFFYLQPTQNPWYWLWAMPLVCFAKNKGWLLISLILFVYYLRFWFTEQADSYQFLGRTYVGHDFFDHCLVWVEFALVLTILLIASKLPKTSQPFLPTPEAR